MTHPNFTVVNTLMQRIPLIEKEIYRSMEGMAQAMIDASVQSDFVTEDLVRSYSQVMKSVVKLLEYSLAMGTKMQAAASPKQAAIINYHVTQAQGDVMFSIARKAGDSLFNELASKATRPADLGDS